MSDSVLFQLETPELSVDAAGGALVRRTVLPSGVRVLSERVPGASSVTVGFWIAVGSRDEEAVAHGSTHFLEHLLFKGTPSRSALDIAVAFDEIGGEHNAVTSREHTCYYAKVRDRDLELAVRVLADMLASSTIDAEEFENEREVILEELAMADDDPSDLVSERFFEAVFGAHPLGRPIGGTPETIRSATRGAVLEHYRHNYRAEELVVTVAGAVDHDALLGWVADALAQSVSPVPRRPGFAEAAPGGDGGRRVVHRELEQANLIVGTTALSANDPRRPALAVLNSVLGGGMSSRLFQEVRERRGLAYSVYSFTSGYSDAGVFGMYAGCNPARVDQVASLMLEEFGRVASDGVSAVELSRARGQLGGAAALSLEDSDTRMSRLGRSELVHGEFTDLAAWTAKLDAVDEDAVRRVAAELASRPVSTVIVGDFGDGGKGDGGDGGGNGGGSARRGRR